MLIYTACFQCLSTTLLFSHCGHCACGCLTCNSNHKRSLAMHEEKRNNSQQENCVTTNGESRFVYVLIGLSLGAIGGLIAALFIDKHPRQLRERSGKSRDYLKRQAGKLRQTAGVILQGGKKLIACKPSDSVVHSTEAEKQAYQEARRENLGG